MSSAASFSQPLGPDSIKPALEGVWTRSVHDALLIISRCLEGELPMVHRRPYDIEKKELVKSGSVFIYSKEETKIDRWTDEKLWTASRQSEGFFYYRQRDEDRPRLCRGAPRRRPTTEVDYSSPDERARGALNHALYGGWAYGEGFTQDGLMKKALTVKVPGAGEIGIIGYYNPLEVLRGNLQAAASVPAIAAAGIHPALAELSKQPKKPSRPAAPKARRSSSATSTRSSRSTRTASGTPLALAQTRVIIPTPRRASTLSLSALSSDSENSSRSTDSGPPTPTPTSVCAPGSDAFSPTFLAPTHAHSQPCAAWPSLGAYGVAVNPPQTTAPVMLAAIDLRATSKPAPQWTGAQAMLHSAPFIDARGAYAAALYPVLYGDAAQWTTSTAYTSHPWDPIMTADPPPPYVAHGEDKFRQTAHGMLGPW